MKNNLSFCVAAICLVFLINGCNTPSTSAVVIPDAIKVEPNEMLIYTAKATGVQIYRCDSIGPDKYAWVNNRPEAVLYDENGKKIGMHYKSTGVAWELAADKSIVIGKKLKESPVTGAIPWLLVDTIGHAGNGILSRVTKIQRVSTEGGLAPEEVADKSKAGKEVRSLYEATYYFYSIKK